MNTSSVARPTIPFDARPLALSARFGTRARQLMADGRDPYVAARLAASFAFRHDPSLRDPASPPLTLAQQCFTLGVALTVAESDRHLHLRTVARETVH